MVGGNEAIFQRAYPLLLRMGAALSWSAQSGKRLDHQAVTNRYRESNIADAAAAKRWSLPPKTGVDPAKAFQAIRGASRGARSWKQKRR